MNAALEGPLNLAGRMLLALIFVASGFGKIADWEGTQGYMASAGMVAIPVFLVGAIVFEIVGGLSVASGFKARWGALALIVFLIPTTLIFHGFWRETEPGPSRVQMINFMKNVAIAGAMLTIVARGAGAWSLDALLADRQKQ
ncbi:MAG TPA: DoxX family protein [Pirellulales bacterium]|jgi:putative oxidoreductase